MNFRIFYNRDNEDEIYIEKEWRGNIYLLNIENNTYYNPTFMTLNRIKSECNGRLSYFFEENLVIVEFIDQENIFKIIKKLLENKDYRSMISMSSLKVEIFLNEIEEFDFIEMVI